MPDYLSPNVYIEEIAGNPPIQGVSTSTAGFIGMAERGPLNVPMLCTSPGDYAYWFGGLLNHDDFLGGNPPRSHCYLPYAVQGFFTNGGQLCYVMRVLPDGARYAYRFLYNRGSLNDPATMLLRTASQGTGTALLPPQVCLLDPTNVTPATILRIGDGSASEYVQVAALPTPLNDYFIVNQRLAQNHPQGKTITYSTAVDSGTPYALADGANAGDTSIIVVASTAPAAPGWLRIGNDGAADIVQFNTVTSLGGTTYSIALASPAGLAAAHAAGEQVSSLTVTAVAGPPGTSSLSQVDASAGDSLVIPKDPTPFVAGTILVAQIDTSSAQEVRAASQLTKLSVVQPANDDLPANSVIAPVAFDAAIASTMLTADTGTNGRVVSLASRTYVNVGTVLQLGPAGSPEYATVAAVNGTRGFAPDPGSVVLSAPLDGSYVAGGTVSVLPPPTSGAALATTTLAALCNPGDPAIKLNSVNSIVVGSVLEIDPGVGTQEYVTVAAVNAPVPNWVELSQPLRFQHQPNGTVNVFASPAANPVARTIFDTPAGAATLVVTSPGTLAANQLISVTTPEGEVSYHNLSAAPIQAGSPGFALPALVALGSPLQRTHAMGSPAVAREALFTVQALDKGAWGNRLWVAVQDEQPGLVAQAQVTGIAQPLQLTLATLTGIERGSYLELFYPNTGGSPDLTPLKVHSIDRAKATINLDNPGLTPQQISAVNTALINPQNPIAVRSREFSLTVMLYRQPDPAIPSRNETILQSEVFRFLSMDTRHSHFIETVIGATDGPLALEDRRPKGGSMLIRVKDAAAGNPATQESARLGPEPLIDLMPGGLTRPARFQLGPQPDQQGDDAISMVDDNMYIGVDDAEPANRMGIPALRNVPDISIVAIPGQGTADIQSALISHCENSLYRFAVLDPMTADASLADIQAQRQAFDTKYAAIYYPWLSIPDPMPANLSSINPFPIPPSGHVVGIYARVDQQRGVFKAPANEVVQGITDLTRKLYKGEQDILNPSPKNINVIRDFRADGRSIRVWGARCITSDTDYTYVPVRRLLMFIEQSIDLGLQWAVFEPNGPPLWSRVTRTIVNFLTAVWRSGALEGTKPDEAFFVQCGPTTMTQSDIDNGRLIAIVGVAPVKPAEFVIVRMVLMTASNGQ